MSRLLTALASFCLLSASPALAGEQDAPPASGLQSLKVRIDTGAFSAMQTFYGEVLGLELEEAWDENGDRGAIYRLPDGGQIEIGFAPDAPPAAGFSLQIEVEDVNAERDRIAPSWPVEGPEPRPWGAIYLYLTDPDGVDIILYERIRAEQ